MPRLPGGMWLPHLLSSLVVRCGLSCGNMLPLLRPGVRCRLLVEQQCVISSSFPAGCRGLTVQSDAEADKLLQQGQEHALEKALFDNGMSSRARDSPCQCCAASAPWVRRRFCPGPVWMQRERAKAPPIKAGIEPEAKLAPRQVHVCAVRWCLSRAWLQGRFSRLLGGPANHSRQAASETITTRCGANSRCKAGRQRASALCMTWAQGNHLRCR